MPMRWTAENCQLLLLKILETHNISVDTKKVAAAWPGTDENNKPTPRAIVEQLAKMRKSAGPDGATNGSNGVGVSNSAPTTPKKGRKSATPGSTKTPGSGKRKRSGNQNEQADDFPKLGKDDTLVVSRGVEGTPSKRSRKSSILPAGMVIYEDQQNDELECESSVSDYVPDESAVKDEDFEM